MEPSNQASYSPMSSLTFCMLSKLSSAQNVVCLILNSNRFSPNFKEILSGWQTSWNLTRRRINRRNCRIMRRNSAPGLVPSCLQRLKIAHSLLRVNKICSLISWMSRLIWLQAGCKSAMLVCFFMKWFVYGIQHPYTVFGDWCTICRRSPCVY